MAKIDHLIEKLNKKEIILLDGGTGTELQRRGVYTGLPLWSAQALLTSPKTVKAVHRDYILAGAQIIKTNTFRTNERTLNKAGIFGKDQELTSLAVNLAKQAIAESGVEREVFIGGSQTTLEDCYIPAAVPDARTAFKEHQRWSETLKQAGVDFIFLETFNTIGEAKLALIAALKTGLPAMVSFTVNAKAELLSGESLSSVVKEISLLKPLAILINCAPPAFITKSLPILARHASLPIGAYGNGLGQPHQEQGWIFDQTGQATDIYCQHVSSWLNNGAQLVGGCCGTNPGYIQEISKLINTNK